MEKLRKHKDGEVDQVWTIELSGVDTILKLSDIALELSKYARSIISISRVADFERFMLKGTVYIQLINESEFIRLTNNVMLILRDKAVRVQKAHDLISSTIKLSIPARELTSQDRLGAPLSLHVFGIQKEVHPSTYIYLLRELLITFEAQAEITGIRLVYDVRRRRNLQYCFINCMYKGQFLNLDQSKIAFNDATLICTASNQIQLLLEPSDANLLLKDFWNNDVRRANKLCEASLAETAAGKNPTVTITVPKKCPELSSNKKKDDEFPIKRVKLDDQLQDKPQGSTNKIIIHSVVTLPPVKSSEKVTEESQKTAKEDKTVEE
ncbi:hypothetical protein PVAND_002364 [Polypedilum vanderplanki]|uniref:Uncharacterized protein n=1 Tax=Polypedilum vanderplanki TaxID=319348 RepID=A0A9J6BS91_POLVA|nr:hypothetical protein PVAND_002364 [Polypedilum vanderplanki]